MDNENPVPRKRGRPAGAKNKATGFKEILVKFEQVYARVENMLTPEQQKYYKNAFSGKSHFDPVKESELFLRLLGLYTTLLITEAIEKKQPSEAIAATAAQYRMGLKDVEEMQRKRDEIKAKDGNDERMVDPTRKPEMAFFENLHREPAK